MGTLYNALTGKVVAVFENGKVYASEEKSKIIGSYTNEDIFEGKGFFKKHIGGFNGRDIMLNSDTVIGYVRKNEVYACPFSNKSTKIAYFDEGEKAGAAAAALITGILGNSKKK